VGLAINAKGTVAGVDAVNKWDKFKSFVRYQSGKVKTFGAPHINGDTDALSINKDNVVVGYFETQPGHHGPYIDYGFIWTP